MNSSQKTFSFYILDALLCLELKKLTNIFREKRTLFWMRMLFLKALIRVHTWLFVLPVFTMGKIRDEAKGIFHLSNKSFLLKELIPEEHWGCRFSKSKNILPPLILGPFDFGTPSYNSPPLVLVHPSKILFSWKKKHFTTEGFSKKLSSLILFQPRTKIKIGPFENLTPEDFWGCGFSKNKNIVLLVNILIDKHLGAGLFKVRIPCWSVF